MSNTKLIALLLGGYLAYTGYTNTTPTPDNPTPDNPKPDIIVEVRSEPVEDYVEITDETLQTLSLPIVDILKSNPDDAIKLARAYQGWSKLLARTTAVDTTEQFQNAYKEAVEILFRNYLSKNYSGSLAEPFKAVIVECFKQQGLADKEVYEAAWSPKAAEAAELAFQTIAARCYEAFITAQVENR